jgi:S1-C subfamily serine protease
VYKFGQGVTQDYAEAVKWYRLAAEQGDSQAQLNLGNMYYVGVGVTQNHAEAVKWYRLAAEQGHFGAQLTLGAMYYEGEGVTQNHAQAYAWFSVAAAQGDQTAREARDHVAEQMTREQIADGQRLAATFVPRPWKGTTSAPTPQPTESSVTVTGSGFFVSANGHFITNSHVVTGARTISIRTDKGNLRATVIRDDPTNDLAILKVMDSNAAFKALSICGSRGLKLADQVSTVGFPNPQLQGESAKYSSGEIGSLAGAGDDPRFLQISVPVQPGNSGGPLVNANGCVVGVVTSQLDKVAALKVTGNLPENVNYAIKGTLLLSLIEAVPGLADEVSFDAPKGLRNSGDIAKMVEAACGMVIVEK